MSSRILVDRAKPEAAEILRFVQAIALVRSQGARIRLRLQSMAANDDWHQVAIELGLPDPAIVSSTEAQDAWSIIMTAVDKLMGPEIEELKRLDQA